MGDGLSDSYHGTEKAIAELQVERANLKGSYAQTENGLVITGRAIVQETTGDHGYKGVRVEYSALDGRNISTVDAHINRVVRTISEGTFKPGDKLEVIVTITKKD